jgi:2-dehydro-3-deoxyphosphogluconate aldolase/(4S)-4-hydroxy-2-oxoglutarate aldolase
MTMFPGSSTSNAGTVADQIRRDGMVPLFGSSDPDTLLTVAEAVAACGLSTLEVTLRSQGALEALTRLIDRVEAAELPITVGVGTVLDPSTAAAAIDQGAQFVFSPMLSTDIRRACAARGIAYFPGCATPTEIHRALDMGCELVKLFPASMLGGPNYLRSVKAVFPDLPAVPTGGIRPEPEHLRQWFDAGAAAVGIGSAMLSATAMAEGGAGAAQRAVESAVAAVAEARRGTDS